jgi:hypothetical protein
LYLAQFRVNGSHAPNAADPPVAVGERDALCQFSLGSQSIQIKPGGSAD